MAVESIAKTLGSGSGIDIKELVSGLVDTSFALKNEALTKKGETLTAKVSAASQLKSGIADFASALSALASGGSLVTQPTSSNTGILNITALSGAKLGNLSASIEVRQLAQSQVASSTAFAGGAATDLGTGTLTLTFGTASVADGAMTGFAASPAAPIAIAIDAAHSSLQGVADAVNAKGAGVTASIMTDASGARLVLKSASGASQAFQLSGTGGLAALDIGVGAGGTIATAAQDAIVALDGVQTSRATNSIYGLIDGARIDLASAAPGTRVTIGTKAPTEALRQTVTNFVDTYNEVYRVVKAAVDPVSGPLRGDSAAKELLRSLKQLTLTNLLPGGAPGTPNALSGIGVGTNRDGTLSLDATRLATALTTYPRDIEAMFASGAGLTKAMSDIAANAVSKTTGLGASEATYGKAQSALADDKQDALDAAEKMRTRMTRQFSAMDARVAAYKSTQDFLTNQIAAWNRDS